MLPEPYDTPQPREAVSTDEIAEAARAAIIEATAAAREAGERHGFVNGLIAGAFAALLILGLLDAFGLIS